MRLSNPVKNFVYILLFLPVFVSCGGSEVDQNAKTQSTSPAKSNVPFSRREPDIYQAEAVITFGDKVRKIHIARKGEKRRIDYDLGTDNERSIINGEKRIVASSPKKIFAEMPDNGTSPEGTPDDMTQSLLNVSQDTRFEEISSENNITKYRVINGDQNTSEIFIYADGELGMPIRTEHFSLTGGERKLLYSFELQNVSRVVDDSIFEPAKDWKSVSYKNFIEETSKKN